MKKSELKSLIREVIMEDTDNDLYLEFNKLERTFAGKDAQKVANEFDNSEFIDEKTKKDLVFKLRYINDLIARLKR